MDMDFTIKTLGECKIKSPLLLSKVKGDGIYDFVEDGERVLYSNSLHDVMNAVKNGQDLVSFEKPGPKDFLYFEPAKTKVAIVTCGGYTSFSVCHMKCANSFWKIPGPS